MLFCFHGSRQLSPDLGNLVCKVAQKKKKNRRGKLNCSWMEAVKINQACIHWDWVCHMRLQKLRRNLFASRIAQASDFKSACLSQWCSVGDFCALNSWSCLSNRKTIAIHSGKTKALQSKIIKLWINGRKLLLQSILHTLIISWTVTRSGLPQCPPVQTSSEDDLLKHIPAFLRHVYHGLFLKINEKNGDC